MSEIPETAWRAVNVTTMEPHLLGFTAEQNARTWRAVEHALRLLTKAGLLHEPIDLAHAVALERERIAAWLETDVAWNIDGLSGMAAAVRSGAHNADLRGREGA